MILSFRDQIGNKTSRDAENCRPEPEDKQKSLKFGKSELYKKYKF